METLHVGEAQFDYVATFAEPAFPLWANVGGLLASLYHGFAGLHAGLESIVSEGESRDPLARSAAVTLRDGAVFRIGYAASEAILPDYSSDELARFPEVLAKADGWLRAIWPRAVVASHLYTFTLDGTVSGGPDAFLDSLNGRRFPGVPASLATGTVFHGRLPDRDWTVQLAVDHSTRVPGGLHVQFALVAGDDQIDPAATLTDAAGFLRDTLAALSLRVEEAP